MKDKDKIWAWELLKVMIPMWVVILTVAFLMVTLISYAKADTPEVKSKFYDFSEQLIDGEVRKPQALYLDVRQKVQFQRLLKLKRNLLGNNIQKTSRERVFK